jgi:hypothetical protein
MKAANPKTGYFLQCEFQERARGNKALFRVLFIEITERLYCRGTALNFIKEQERFPGYNRGMSIKGKTAAQFPGIKILIEKAANLAVIIKVDFHIILEPLTQLPHRRGLSNLPRPPEQEGLPGPGLRPIEKGLVYAAPKITNMSVHHFVRVNIPQIYKNVKG